MNTCPNCHEEVDGIEEACPACGHVLSVSDDTMETLVQAASIPNLATLFQRGKDSGLIKAASAGYDSAT